PDWAITSIITPQVLVCVASVRARAAVSFCSSVLPRVVPAAFVRRAISCRLIAGCVLVAAAIKVAAELAALNGTPAVVGGSFGQAPFRMAAMIGAFLVLTLTGPARNGYGKL